MMKTKYIIGLIWLATSLSACNSLFDDELPKSQIAAKEAIKDQASAETALLGVYFRLFSGGRCVSLWFVGRYLSGAEL